ncbi:MAG: cytochrome c biogenesis protein CcdA [bacterium]
MRRIISSAIAVLALLVSVGAMSAIDVSEPFNVVSGSEGASLQPGSNFEFTVTIRVPEGYYLYADETDVDFTSFEGLIVSDVSYPKPESRMDPFLGKKASVYDGDLTIRIKGKIPAGLASGSRELTALVSYRGCSPTLCFRRQEQEVAFTVDVLQHAAADARPLQGPSMSEEGEGAIPVSLKEKLGLKDLLEIRDFSVLLDQGVAFTILIVFLAGVLTSLTPCVWPVLPAVFLFIGIHPHKRFAENLSIAGALVLGLILTYAALGMAAVALGRNLGFLFQQRWFLSVVVIFFIAMSLSMFGAFDVRLPRRLAQRIHKLGGEGYWGSFLAGVGLGLVASPCSGPVLAALLGHVALQRSFLVGFGLLVVFGMGMGAILVLLGSCYGELAGKLRGGPWLVWVKRLLGVMLLFPAAFYMGSLLGWSAGSFAPSFRPGIQWLTDEAEALAQAKRAGKPMMMEFTADWCPPCRTLERDFFSRSDIIELGAKLVCLRVDATVETSDVRDLIEKYRVMGWPTVIFLTPAGKPIDELKVGDYDPTAVEEGMRKAQERR